LPETDHPQPGNDNYGENANQNETGQQPEIEGQFQNATSNRLNNENLFILLQQQQLQLQQQQEQQQQMTLLLEAALNRPSTTNQAIIKSTLGVFDGNTDFLVYKTQFENAAARVGWTTEEKCFQLTQRLRGDAAKVYGNLLRIGTPITFPSLIKQLDKHFTQHVSSAQARSTLFSIKQSPNQSVTEFARELEQAGRAYFINVPESFVQENLFDLFVKGLCDHEAQLFCKYSPTKTLEAALDLVTSSSTIELPPAKKSRIANVAQIVNHTNPSSQIKATNRDDTNTSTASINVVNPHSPERSSNFNQPYPIATAAPSQTYRHSGYNRPPARGRGRPRGSFAPRGRGKYGGNPQQFTSNNQNPNSQQCYRCQQFGHFARDCPNTQTRADTRHSTYRSPYYKTAITWYDRTVPQNLGYFGYQHQTPSYPALPAGCTIPPPPPTTTTVAHTTATTLGTNARNQTTTIANPTSTANQQIDQQATIRNTQMPFVPQTSQYQGN